MRTANGWPTAMLVVVLLAGCVDDAGSREAYVRELPADPDTGDRFAFGADAWPVSLTFFNLSEAGRAEYRFRVGDGGTARGCIHTQDTVADALEAAYARVEGRTYRHTQDLACTDPHNGAEAGTPLGAGAYALVLFPVACPARDCMVWSSLEHTGEASGGATLVLVAPPRP